MYLKSLQYFVEVANCRSINKAAQHLYISQPALTQAIISLEQELDCQLFNRSKSGVTLTEAGEKIYTDALVINNLINNWAQYSAKNKNNTTQVHVATLPFAGSSICVNAINLLKETHPHIELIAHEMTRDKMFDFFLDKKATIGVITTPPEDFEALRSQYDKLPLSWELIYEDYSYLCFSSQNSLAKQEKSIEIKDIQNSPIITYYDTKRNFLSSIYEKIFFNLYSKELIKVSSTEALINQLISYPEAIGFIMGFRVHTNPLFKNKTLKAVKISDYPLPLHHYLFFPDEQHIRKEEKIVLEAIHQCYKKIPCSNIV